MSPSLKYCRGCGVVSYGQDYQWYSGAAPRTEAEINAASDMDAFWCPVCQAFTERGYA